MKKFFSYALVASVMVAGFASCSNDEDGSNIAQQGQTPIGIGKVKADFSLATRGVATSSGSIVFTDFQTWAFDKTTNGMYMGTSETVGKTVTKDGDKWGYSPTQYWPVNPLNFVSVAPAQANGLTITGATSTEGVATLTTNLTLSTDVENQDDIMFAEGNAVTKTTDEGNVPFSFQHALSQIVFKGRFNDEGAVTKVTIAEIALGGINKTGTLDFNSNGKFYGGAVRPATVSTPAIFSLDGADLEGDTWEAATEGTTAFDLTVSANTSKKNAWFLIPQATAAAEGDAYVGGDAPATGAYLKIRAKLEKDGVVILDNTEADALYIPLTVAWEQGKKYTYTIEFNGSTALTPITFSVAATDWTDANPQPDDLSM